MITFAGYYGFDNTGDDSFIEVASWGSKKYWDQDENIFLSKKLPVIMNKASAIGDNEFRGHYMLKSLRSILKSNAFICAGGSTFHSELSWKDPREIARVKKSIVHKFKLGAIGVSIGPYLSNKAEKQLISFFQQLDFLALRDIKSFQIASSYNLPYKPIQAFDLAALLPSVYGGKKNYNVIDKGNKKIIGISICNYESYIVNGDINKEQFRIKAITSLLNQIICIQSNICLRFFIFNGNSKVGDEQITLEVISKLKSNHTEIEIIKYDPVLFNTWSKIKQCNVLIATRLHAANFACFADVPFFLIEYHRKCNDFLNDIGYNPEYRLQDANFNIIEVSELISGILKDKSSYKKPKFIEQCVEKAILNFTQIKINE